MTDSRTPVTVIGLGAMGTALAEALLAGGHDVTVWNRTSAKAEPLAAKGARAAATVEEAIAASPLVIACVLDYPALHATLDPVATALADRVLVNLTNGTPEQARATADWATEAGAQYVDGGIMAIPPMIGHPGSTLLYSGAREAFDTHRETLERFGVATYLGTDPGAAPLHDLALLCGMYGMFGGFFHAVGLVGTEGVKASEFTTTLLLPWLNAMMTAMTEFARLIDAGDFESRDSNLAMQSAGYVNLIEASRAQGLRTELIEPMRNLIDRAVAEGKGGEDLPGLITLLSATPSS
ncbi:NAD(P)-dependent oxidoreductase [Streptomyces specialis]|uniref:NAD(P)-dependent oxidoreductase n=1 Tax=Streptomyces specialis TaxID=498367 RepID=UPI00073EAAC9|nr:NAD(P)-binding domain-containing protein [Streptomyces specialis]